MNIEIEEVKDKFNFFKKNTYLKNNKFDIKKLIRSLIKDTITFTGLSLIFSNVLNYFQILSYKNQLDILESHNFNSSVMLTFLFVLLCIMIEGVIQSSKTGETLGSKFSSVFLPIKVAIMTTLLIPINDSELTTLSAFLKEIIKFTFL